VWHTADCVSRFKSGLVELVGLEPTTSRCESIGSSSGGSLRLVELDGRKVMS
jgi:hypothetical protein